MNGRAMLLAGVLCALLAGIAGIPAASDGDPVADNEDGVAQDMLTPEYYLAAQGSGFREDVNRFIQFARQVTFWHPLADAAGNTPLFSIPAIGSFGASKGPSRDVQHHPAIDLHIDGRATEVDLRAAHDGIVRTMRDVPKYRHAITITRDIVDSDGELLGKLVTLYGHVDLDLDEASGLFMDGQRVTAGDLISRHLYAGTVGGPHLHFEVRYYRPGDTGVEEFYGGSVGPSGNPSFTEPSAGIWSHGFWHPDIGYGYADPRNHGVKDPT